MAKVKWPLFSGDVSGKFGNKFIFKKGGIVTRMFWPRNPGSAAQQAQRELFKEFSMAGLTQEQADLLYAAIMHLHDDHYAALVHAHDHGDLDGLGDDDHTQYLNQTRGDARYLQSVPQQDHGGLAGLGDDDHAQYYNQTRGDARYLRSGIAPTWTAPTLLNSWVWYGGNDPTVGWFKDSDNLIHLRGSVKSGTMGTTMFVLPVGSRPAYHTYYFVPSNSGIGWVEVFQNGNVNYANGQTLMVCLDGIIING